MSRLTHAVSGEIFGGKYWFPRSKIFYPTLFLSAILNCPWFLSPCDKFMSTCMSHPTPPQLQKAVMFRWHFDSKTRLSEAIYLESIGDQLEPDLMDCKAVTNIQDNITYYSKVKIKLYIVSKFLIEVRRKFLLCCCHCRLVFAPVLNTIVSKVLCQASFTKVDKGKRKNCFPFMITKQW